MARRPTPDRAAATAAPARVHFDFQCDSLSAGNTAARLRSTGAVKNRNVALNRSTALRPLTRGQHSLDVGAETQIGGGTQRVALTPVRERVG